MLKLLWHLSGANELRWTGLPQKFILMNWSAKVNVKPCQEPITWITFPLQWFKFDQNFLLLSSKFCSSDCHKILHETWQLWCQECATICGDLNWSKAKFISIGGFRFKNCRRDGLPIHLPEVWSRTKPVHRNNMEQSNEGLASESTATPKLHLQTNKNFEITRQIWGIWYLWPA